MIEFEVYHSVARFMTGEESLVELCNVHNIRVYLFEIIIGLVFGALGFDDDSLVVRSERIDDIPKMRVIDDAVLGVVTSCHAST